MQSQTDHALNTRVFPRFRKFSRFFFLALNVFSVLRIGICDNFGFGFAAPNRRMVYYSSSKRGCTFFLWMFFGSSGFIWFDYFGFFSLASVSRNVFLSRCSLPPSSNNKQMGTGNWRVWMQVKPFHLMELPGNAAIQDVSVFLSVETWIDRGTKKNGFKEVKAKRSPCTP